MKAFLFSLALLALAPVTDAASPTNGFLVFKVSRYAYRQEGKAVSDVEQSFKVPLTGAFLAHFRKGAGHPSGVMGFFCVGGRLKTHDQTTMFTWWLWPEPKHHWLINMWGEGDETVTGVRLNSRDPVVSESLKIKKLADLDMTSMISYNSKEYSGLNVEFKAEYMSAKEMKAAGPIPTAPVKNANGTYLFKGDDLSHCPIEFDCAFQGD